VNGSRVDRIPRLSTLVLAGLLLFAGCGRFVERQPETPPAATAATPLPLGVSADSAGVPPAEDIVPITDDAGNQIAQQPGPLWVLISGVDEHGLIAEHEVNLLVEPDAAADAVAAVHSGVAAFVYEIRQTGPQNLRRFYRVQALSGPSGWVSDYYVRRLTYLYNDNGERVALYDAPAGEILTTVPNITPVVLREPVNPTWWVVESVEGDIRGWVQVNYVKESPELEFLLNQQHGHIP
jgi:hypothetical protein